MTGTTGATCPTCTAVLETAGAPCPSCAGGPYGPPAGMARPTPQQTPYPGTPYQSPPSPGVPYQPTAYQPTSHQPPSYPSHPYPPHPYAPTPYPSGQFHAAPPAGPFPAAPTYPPAPHHAGPYAVRAPKSAGVAVLLTLLWIGAGHLYLDRMGTGLVLMGAHFFLGFLLLVVFAPLGFVVWLGAAVGCSIWCTNLAAQINAGTVPPRQTW